ncbi:MAG: NAD(+)/NADH kinase, partial [Chloroflexota bacterium]|nr:NAD(+)/NADH kinase [Chloroflexota bacterium]
MDKFYSPKIIAILFNQKSKDAESLALGLKQKLKDDFEVFSQSAESALNNGLNNEEIDLIISIGGDGTVLRCAHVLNGSNCPILGINLGRLGFLCEIDSNDLDQKLLPYLNGNGVLEKRSVLKIS